MPENSDQSAQQINSRNDLVDALRIRLECLKETAMESTPETDRKVAEVLAILVKILGKIEQTIYSQLEVMGKNNPRVKSLAETAQNQNLLNIEEALKAVLDPKSTRLTRLTNYGELLLRWWSAMLAGVQTTVMEFPNELEEALNHSKWQVEKKRWSGEEAAYWNHFKHVIRHELPLRLGDKMKNMQAAKTLDAYSIIGKGQLSDSREE